MKEFKTYEEQIEILKTRGLLIKNEKNALSFLERNNYYNVINAYKDIFVDKIVLGEKYISGVSFDSFKALWAFDKILRHELFRFIIIVERNIKSKLMYHIAQKYGVLDYLNIDFFNPYYVVEASQLISIINKEIASQFEKNQMIKHYKSQGYLPPWVLANILTFGNISKLYQCHNHSMQNTIAKDLSRQLAKKIFPDNIINSLKIINLFRNLCAHDQRLFDYMPYTSISEKHPVNIHCNSGTAYGLFALICSMYTLQDASDFRALIKAVSKAFEYLKPLGQDFINIIHQKTGFTQNWLDLLNI